MEAEVAGAQRQVLSSFTGPGVQVKAGDGVYLCFFHNTFLKLSWPCSRTSRTRKSVHWVLDSGQEETRCGRVTRHKGKIGYQLASQQDRFTFAVMKIQIPKVNLKKNKIFFEHWYFSVEVACVPPRKAALAARR